MTKLCATACKVLPYSTQHRRKIEILHLYESLRIDSVNIGLPGAGTARAFAHTEALAPRNRHAPHEIKPLRSAHA